jgi:putative heme-binding domain-containing protein
MADLGSGHDWARGRELFRRAACGVCHAMGTESEGTGLAPDLTGVASTFSREFILQSILEPSATINGRFFHTKFTLKNGEVVTGSVVDVAGKKILVAPVMMNPQATVEISQAEVKSEEPSPVSPMPPGLLNEFTKEEIVELMAYLDAGGDRTAAVYRKK